MGISSKEVCLGKVLLIVSIMLCLEYVTVSYDIAIVVVNVSQLNELHE